MARPLGSKNKTQEEVVGSIPVVTVEKPEVKVEVKRVRKYSDNKDHKGEGQPLCLGCNHREDMHYIERRWTERRMAKNLQGDIGEIEVPMREAVYTGSRPCQHACLCKAYE